MITEAWAGIGTFTLHGGTMRIPCLGLFFCNAVQYFQNSGVLATFSYSFNLVPIYDKAASFVKNNGRCANRAIKNYHGCAVAQKYFKSLFAMRAIDLEGLNHG
jgi:hypothetical protein